MATISKNGSRLKQSSKVLRDAKKGASAVARGAIDDVLSEAETALKSGRRQIGAWQVQALESIRAKPIRAVLSGVAIGCALGLFLRRR